jgi:protein TonB
VVQPRPPIAPPPDVTPPPPLPIPPVKERVEQTAPPIISSAPPAPVTAPPARASVVTRPDWARKPNADDMARYYPDRAQRMEVGGRATIRCTVNAKGSLENCSVVSESPADYGFGDAALKLSRLFRMKPKTLDGAPVDGGEITVPITFQVPQ